jgi:MerR family redox-sensitive transcriptional activator SoxR
MEGTGYLPIGEIARRAGLQPSAIRYYEQIGLLPAPARRNGRRRYDPAVLDRLTLIRVGQAAGLTLAEIRELVAGMPGTDAVPIGARWQSLARRKLAEIEELMAQVERMRRILRQALGCTCVTVEECARAEWCPVAAESARG